MPILLLIATLQLSFTKWGPFKLAIGRWREWGRQRRMAQKSIQNQWASSYWMRGGRLADQSNTVLLIDLLITWENFTFFCLRTKMFILYFPLIKYLSIIVCAWIFSLLNIFRLKLSRSYIRWTVLPSESSSDINRTESDRNEYHNEENTIIYGS